MIRIFCGIGAGTTIELHGGSATGPILATGSTGVLSVQAGNKVYVLVENPNGGPFGLPRQLATEATSLNTRPLRCSFAAQPVGEVDIVRNPVLGCASPPNTGTEADVSGSVPYETAPDRKHLIEIRVGSPSGPLFTAHLDRYARDTTGDWLRNGMEFFLSLSGAPEVVLASQRAYVLPIRDCRNKKPPPPAISATRDCAQASKFTLAFVTGEPDPVAIRENGVDGPIVALQNVLYVGGLVDVTTATRKTYYLTTLQNGVWESLGSALADPAQVCGQGKPQ